MEVQMAVIQILSFIIVVLLLSYYWKEDFVTVLPGAVCGLVLLLYVLAICRHLAWIDFVQIGVLVFVGMWLAVRKKKEVLSYWKEELRRPSFWAAAVMIGVVAACVSGKVVSWWDDVNFWATDVKSLYYLDGFAGKYGNAAPEFGDYPPGAQLFKWWFLHMDTDIFREGLAFVGYHLMNLVFLLPLFGKVKGKNVLVIGLMSAVLWWFPSIAEVYGYQGFCADLTMACIYGGFLYGVTDREGHKESFYYGRLALYLSVLVIIKSVGFIWVAFGLLFLYLHYFLTERDDRTPRRNLYLAMVTLSPVLSGGSWMLFCLLMRRVTKTTATAVKYMTTDEYGLSGYMGEFAKAFVQAFFTEPLHKEKTWALDLTPFGLYLCICLLVIFFWKKSLMSKKQGKLVLWFSIVSGALFYGIIFLAHITIFATETQYLTPSGMISSIERYGAPFTVGTLLFLSFLWMEYGDKLFAAFPSFFARYGTCLCLVLAVALTAGWRTGYDGLIGYRETVPDILQERDEMVDEDAEHFLQKLWVLDVRERARVFYIQRDDQARWVRNSYTNLAASPVSVVYKGVNLEDATGGWLADEIRASHANYLYVEESEADTAALFADMLPEGIFETQSLYRIEDDGSRIRLWEVE